MENFSARVFSNNLEISFNGKIFLFKDVLVASNKMLDVIKKACTYSKHSDLICLTGESGVGKEIVYKIINKIFGIGKELVVNCGAINENLLESELFGHRKGSFTNAINDRRGAFIEAGSGVLFLDEIGELSTKAQVKLLRALEYNEIKPVGSDISFKHRAKVVLATNRDLPKMVSNGTFRKDLFYRVEGYMVKVPPLRERQEELESFARWFFGIEYSLSKTLISYLKNYAWPGNIRELKNAVSRAKLNSNYGDKSVTWDMLGLLDYSDFEEPGTYNLREAEERLVRAVYVNTAKNISKASDILGIPRTTLYSKLRKYKVLRA